MARHTSPAHPVDPVVEAYKGGVDRTLLRRNLQLTPSERLLQLQQAVAFLSEVRAAGVRARTRADGETD